MPRSLPAPSCGWDVADWLVETARHDADETFRAAFDAALTRRLRREPVAYITGEREFYGRPFRVTPRRADPAAGDRAGRR